jgi:hypothetical protein
LSSLGVIRALTMPTFVWRQFYTSVGYAVEQAMFKSVVLWRLNSVPHPL